MAELIPCYARQISADLYRDFKRLCLSTKSGNTKVPNSRRLNCFVRNAKKAACTLINDDKLAQQKIWRGN